MLGVKVVEVRRLEGLLVVSVELMVPPVCALPPTKDISRFETFCIVCDTVRFQSEILSLTPRAYLLSSTWSSLSNPEQLDRSARERRQRLDVDVSP